MSYRSFKRILGETSLERKCRFLFGGALLLLITGSFYFYAQLNLRILKEQNRQRAELLIQQNFFSTHIEAELRAASDQPEEMAHNEQLSRSFAKLSDELKQKELREDYWKFIALDWEKAPAERRPVPQFEFAAMGAIEGGAPYYEHSDREAGTFHFFEPVLAAAYCLDCHAGTGTAQPRVEKAGQMMAVGQVTFDLDDMEFAIARNNAILVIMAIITTCLAMGAAYVIVRYVIVKPVIHLKDVSDAIAQGNLDQRADIRTGDEFQDLSHAYNRMLRHLVTTQEELREVNADLDGKVDELARANLSLHEMNKIKSEFLATMSHELRTPLNSILGFSEVLNSADNLSDKQRKYVSNISNSGQSLLVLINDILDLAKIEAGRMELHLVELSLEDLIDRLTSSMRPLAEKKNIDLRWEVGPDLPIVYQDHGKLQQVLFNLLSNAVKFTPEGGRIQVLAQRSSPTQFDLVVADTGIGISLEDQAVIFEKFRQGQHQQGTNSLTREFEGTGLGLSIVKELSKLLGGEVILESEFGKGSTFTVRLPLHLHGSGRMDTERAPAPATNELLRQAAAYSAGPQTTSQRDAG